MHDVGNVALALAFLQSCTFDTSVEVAETPVASRLRPVGLVSQSDSLGGTTGSLFGPTYCPAGSVVVGLDGDFYLGGDDGAGFCEVQAVCAELSIQGSQVSHTNLSQVPVGTTVGDCGTNRIPQEALLCPDQQVVVGLAATQGGLYLALTEIELRCGAIDSTGFIFNRAFTELWGQPVAPAGTRQRADCTDPSVAVGIHGRAGIVINRLGFLCQSLSPDRP